MRPKDSCKLRRADDSSLERCVVTHYAASRKQAGKVPRLNTLWAFRHSPASWWLHPRKSERASSPAGVPAEGEKILERLFVCVCIAEKMAGVESEGLSGVWPWVRVCKPYAGARDERWAKLWRPDEEA